jgi:hypothetical protein
MPENLFYPGALIITASPGQWDALLSACYDSGYIILQVEQINGAEKFTKAFKKTP